MKPFLSSIIDKILANKGVPLHDVAIILPNRRARRLLLQGLYEANGRQPMFAPQIFPMEEFVAWLSPLKVTDQVTQLMRLNKLTGHYSGSRFDQHHLLSWGIAFLKDISDMDMQLQDVPAILREHAQAAAFEIPFGKDELSPSDCERIQFNELLADIYIQYKSLLREHAEAYEGMIYRDCAENIADYAAKLPFKRLIFAGFYALSPSELEIIRYLQQHFSTEIYFDVDPFYCHIEEESSSVSRQKQETSFFIQRNCEKLQIDFEKMAFFEPDYANIPKKVNIVSTSKNMRQIYAAIAEVEQIKAAKLADMDGDALGKDGFVNMSDTAVVLADENLMLPFLISYHPENVKINATMGFPFESTPVCLLLQQAMSLYESAFALTQDEDQVLSFSGEVVERLWDHELLRDLKPVPFYFPTVIRHAQIPYNQVFPNVAKAQIARNLPIILQEFCNFADSVTEEPLYKQLWQEVACKLEKAEAVFDQFYEKDQVLDFAFARFAVSKFLSEISISMQGDLDTGLQVMGLLETRMMDFKNVIMLSVNEGILPKGISYNSLIPFDFKFKFDGKDALPNYLYQDQVYAYHFFRLLQRAENVTLLYNSASDENLAEKSRLIAQLEYEVQAQHLEEVIDIRHQKLDFNLLLPEKAKISMKKTEEVMKLLSAYVFSPSSLQTYIACPLKFYFKHLLRVRQTPVISDHLGANELGTVIHALYKRAFDEIKKEPDPSRYAAILQRNIDNSDDMIREEIRKLDGRKSLTDNDFEQGYWRINRRIIGETVNNYLNMAKEELVCSNWRIDANEMKVDIRDYQIFSADGKPSFTVRLTGSLDRVQKDGRDVMILDYKSGSVKPGKLQIKWKDAASSDKDPAEIALGVIFSDSDYDKLFQLVMYMLMYDYVTPEKPDSVLVGIISTREANMGHKNYILPALIQGRQDVLPYKKVLSKLLNQLFCDIFDKKNPFVQTEDKDQCKYCDYLHLCGRQTPTGSRM